MESDFSDALKAMVVLSTTPAIVDLRVSRYLPDGPVVRLGWAAVKRGRCLRLRFDPLPRCRAHDGEWILFRDQEDPENPSVVGTEDLRNENELRDVRHTGLPLGPVLHVP